MKKLKFLIPVTLIFLVFSSCSTEDKIVDIVTNDLQRGAVLRTLETVSANFDLAETAPKWEIVIEEQDQQNGNLLSKVDVFVSFTDKTDDGTDHSKPETLLKSFAASEFTTSQVGLPKTTVSSSLSEATGALSLNTGQYNVGDSFTFRLVVELTDGRTYTDADASGNISGGSFYRSPYTYTADIVNN